MKTKGKQLSRRDRGEKRDRLSELPDDVLLHILELVNTKNAVQTCVLSKRWKDLWKRLTTLYVSYFHFRRTVHVKYFVSNVLSGRDRSISLVNLQFRTHNVIRKLMYRLLKYAVLHNIQRLSIIIDSSRTRDIAKIFNRFTFCCTTLTFLKLRVAYYYYEDYLELPKSLQLPALKSLYLQNIHFSASDNYCSEPFSTCRQLNTLEIDGCHLHHDVKILRISNVNLSHFKLRKVSCSKDKPEELVLSTPNLTSVSVINNFRYPLISSTCNLSFLEEAYIHAYSSSSVALECMHVFLNIKKLTLSEPTLVILFRYLSNVDTTIAQPPCFVRLELLRGQKHSNLYLDEKEVNLLMEYLLRNSPLTKVYITKCDTSIIKDDEV